MNASDQGQRSASEPLEQSVPVDSSRRRFARAGLSGTVVLGSLVSKPVLGAVPYHCTVSGQVSGNLSRGLTETCRLGQSTATWLLLGTAWPEPDIKRGTLPAANNCSFTGGDRVKGTEFNGYTPGGGVPALSAVFFNTATGGGNTGLPQACSVLLTSSTNPSTMLQVLALPDTITDERFILGRVVVTSLLNAVNMGDNYPVTTHTIIAMFNATFGGGTYSGDSTHQWTRTRVIEYLQSLYLA